MSLPDRRSHPAWLGGPAVRALAARPGLWSTAVVLWWRLARPGWWRHWPPVPRPDPNYVRFRAQTAFGDSGAAPTADELVDYLEWCRRMASLRRRPARPPLSHDGKVRPR